MCRQCVRSEVTHPLPTDRRPWKKKTLLIDLTFCCLRDVSAVLPCCLCQPRDYEDRVRLPVHGESSTRLCGLRQPSTARDFCVHRYYICFGLFDKVSTYWASYIDPDGRQAASSPPGGTRRCLRHLRLRPQHTK